MAITNKTKNEITTYYEDTGMDYQTWSKEFNMHFGYYKWPMNPFNREPMLNQMNLEVFKLLKLNENDNLIYDLGCGMAAPSRAFAKLFPNKMIKSITIVPWQIEKANELNKLVNLDKNIEMIQGDFTNLPFETNSADGAYAMESACHAEGADKIGFVKELIRILKPGKNFVIADGFVKKDTEKFNFIAKFAHDQIAKGWALPSFPHLYKMIEALEDEGATNIEVIDVSFKIAPSVLHAPFEVLGFLIKSYFRGDKLNEVRLGHLKASFLGLVLGMHRHLFSYCLVTGNKKH
jgi:MPBQ/MSBQ methyltransferase